MQSEFLVLDHIKPVFRAGGHHPDNLVTACYACNRIRGRRTLAEWWRADPPSEIKYRTLLNRLADARNTWRQGEARFRGQAEALLGQVPGVPPAGIVLRHNKLVQHQWAHVPTWLQAELAHEREQADLVCAACLQPRRDLITTSETGQVSQLVDLDEDFTF